jgi:hypothetical protein
LVAIRRITVAGVRSASSTVLPDDNSDPSWRNIPNISSSENLLLVIKTFLENQISNYFKLDQL